MCAVHGAYSDSNYSGRDAIQTIRAWNADRKLDLAIMRGACGRSMGYSPRIEYVNHFSILSIESQLVSNIS
jgi:hypothetical protein